MLSLDNRFLMLERSQQESFPGWCTPGGYKKEGEEDFRSLVREIEEELNLNVHESDLLTRVKTEDPRDGSVFVVDYHGLKIPGYSGELSLNQESKSYTWHPLESRRKFSTEKEEDYKLAFSSDKVFFNKLERKEISFP